MSEAQMVLAVSGLVVAALCVVVFTSRKKPG